MTSAVLDAALCVLLVSAAVVTVVDARRQADAPTVEQATDPDEVVGLLSSVTTTVSYGQRIETAGASRERPDGDRLGETRHGTLAELLAFATVRSTRADGVALFTSADAVARAVRVAVRQVLDRETRVVARWSPILGGHFAGKVAVGPRPPPAVDVHAARLTVPLPTLGSGSVDGNRAETSESSAPTATRRVARDVAELIVTTLFPPEITRSVLFEGTRRGKLVAGRYDRVGRVYGVEDAAPTTADRVPAANARLVESIAARLVGDLDRRDGTSSPRNRVGVDHVTIVVRTWDG